MSKRKGALECQYCGKVMKTPRGRSAHEHMVHGHGMTPEAHAKAVERRRKRNARLEAESQHQSLAAFASIAKDARNMRCLATSRQGQSAHVGTAIAVPRRILFFANRGRFKRLPTTSQ
jgi:hypothetical protein